MFKSLLGRLPFFLGLGIPAVIVFRFLISPGDFVWGDSPFFWKESFGDLVSFEPSAWTARGNN